MKTPDNLQAALEAHEKGYLPVAMLPGQKIPAEPWKRWLEEEVTVESIFERWEGTRNGLAIICDGIVVIDVDDENELDFAIENAGKTPCICRTPRGGAHMFFRRRKGLELGTQTKVKGRQLDLLTGVSLSNIPPSTNEEGVPYTWLGEGLYPKDELPIAKIAWSRTRTRKKVVTTVPAIADTNDPTSLLYRGRLYVDTFPRVGEDNDYGHTAMFVASMKIARFVNFDPALAWDLLAYFNSTKVDQPWDLQIPAERKALEHKSREGLRLARR